jgi:hypothetical protein
MDFATASRSIGKLWRELILRFALLLRRVPEVAEADHNPIRCMTTGGVVPDTRLRIERRAPIERVKTRSAHGDAIVPAVV